MYVCWSVGLSKFPKKLGSCIAALNLFVFVFFFVEYDKTDYVKIYKYRHRKSAGEEEEEEEDEGEMVTNKPDAVSRWLADEQQSTPPRRSPRHANKLVSPEDALRKRNIQL